MKLRTSRVLTYVASLLLFWAIAAPSAHAYIDPGSTNFIIQIIIGALAGAGLAIATFWRRIKLFFSRNKTDDTPVTPAASAPPAPATPATPATPAAPAAPATPPPPAAPAAADTPPVPPSENNPTE